MRYGQTTNTTCRGPRDRDRVETAVDAKGIEAKRPARQRSRSAVNARNRSIRAWRPAGRSEDDIRRRAYQRYLERGGAPRQRFRRLAGGGAGAQEWRSPRTDDLTMAAHSGKARSRSGSSTFPIELHTAVRNHRPKFRMLHAKDKSPVRFERVCIRDGHPVAWEDLVKGYEYAEGPLRRRSRRKTSRRPRSRRRGRSTSSTS